MIKHLNMSKYIPTEKVIAEIERHIKHYETSDRDDFKNGELYICQELLSFIISLQKEQLEVALIYKPNMTISEMVDSINGKQSEADLEKEVDKFLNETGAPYVWCNDDEQKEWLTIVAHHFYELGRNARKEE